MRHIPSQRMVGWLVLGLLVVAAVLAVQSWVDTVDGYYGNWRYLTYAAPIALSVGTLVGAADDALNRAAATIPTSVGALLLGIVALAAFGGLAASRR